MTEYLDPPRESLSTVKVLTYAFSQRYLGFLLQLATSVILARLLTPRETGIYSLAMSAVGIAAVLREFGANDFIVSQKELTQNKIRSIFTLTGLIAWTIAAILFFLAEPLSVAYNENGVATAMRVLCLNFVLVPLGTTASAILAKSLRFDVLFWITFASQLVGSFVTVVCAYAGASYASPAWGAVAATIATVLILTIRDPKSVFLVPSLSEFRLVLRFGGTVSAAKLVEAIAARSDDFIISAVIGFHASGLLSKANSLNGGFYVFFASAVLSVAAPIFAKLRHSDRDIHDLYARVLALLSVLQWTFFSWLAICATEIITVLFGSTWLESLPLLQIGAVQGGLYAPFMLANPMLTALGVPRVQLVINCIYASALIMALAVGSKYGLVYAVMFSVVAHLFRMIMWGRAVEVHGGIKLLSSVRSLKYSALIALVSALFMVATTYGCRIINLPGMVLLLVTGVVGVCAVLTAARFLGHPLWAEVSNIFQNIRS